MAEDIDPDLLRQTVRDFFANELPAKVRAMDESAELSDELWDAVGEARLVRTERSRTVWRVKFDYLAATVLNEELAKQFGSLAADVLVGMIARLLDEFGTPEQQEAWLPDVVTGGKDLLLRHQ